MMSLSKIRAALPYLLLLVSSLAVCAQPAQDHTFSTSTAQSKEVQFLVKLLEEVHYNRDAVKPGDYGELIGDYMTDLDGSRMFFLESDKQAFTSANSSDSLYWNISTLGKIDYAYQIFKVYEERTHARVAWIFEELKKPIDLTTPETYTLDRTKAAWPANPAEADELWRRRLKFEILDHVLSNKNMEPAAALESARTHIRKRYERMEKNIAEIESTDLAEIFLGALARMYDPHSTYFSADTFEDFNIQMRLQLVGIGAMLSLEDDLCVIKEIVPGGPADLSKQVHPGDKIISVGQQGIEPIEVIGMKLRKIVDMIRGTKGTPVRLLIQPGNATDSSVRKDVTLVRDVVKLDSARAFGAIFEVPDIHGTLIPMGVITLPQFYGPDGGENAADQPSATADVASLIEKLEASGIKGLVLDLRRNGGGLLSEAIELTGLFIQKGPVVQVRSYFGEVKVDEDEDPKVAYGGPLAVLVSRYSASASEIVAGALQNYGRAIVIGDSSTHGKGTVQTVVEMKNIVPGMVRSPFKMGAAKLTVQKFYLPNGSSTQLKGVIPDIVLPSIDMKVGEKELPHALVWDEIPTSHFEGKPLDNRILGPLRAKSLEREASLEEFAYLRKSIDFYRSKQDMKTVSLNLEDRRRTKATDDAFRKDMLAERAKLAKNDFKYTEVLLAPPPPPRIKEAPDPDDPEANVEDPGMDDENQHFAKVDIDLRESFRVLSDALALGEEQDLWVSDHAPLTAEVRKKG
ncbi:MAG: carboxy terminal-processing peptidase [Opitutaceae bacterium]|nr:carboxy terminal-processing peptidase [Opitutaceae bacterium]